jgi:hypothetical protein
LISELQLQRQSINFQKVRFMSQFHGLTELQVRLIVVIFNSETSLAKRF